MKRLLMSITTLSVVFTFYFCFNHQSFPLDDTNRISTENVAKAYVDDPGL